MSKKIKLTKSKFALIDNSDYKLISKFKWHTHFDGYNYYAARNVSASKNNGTRTTISMHVSLLGKIKNKEIDHIDGNGLNNQRKNLRWATHSQNLRNREIQSNNKSGYKGVSLHSCGKWRAYCYLNKKQYHLGLFKNKKLADDAYKNFAQKHYKQFSKK